MYQQFPYTLISTRISSRLYTYTVHILQCMLWQFIEHIYIISRLLCSVVLILIIKKGIMHVYTLYLNLCVLLIKVATAFNISMPEGKIM